MGERQVRSLRALLLILGLLLGQIGLGRVNYLLPDGRSCFTCPTLEDSRSLMAAMPDRDSVGTVKAAMGVAHGDCHDCCTLTAKSPDTKSARAVADGFSFHVAAILPKPLPTSVPELRPVRAVVPTFVDAHPPNGPPILSASRAPPAFSVGN